MSSSLRLVWQSIALIFVYYVLTYEFSILKTSQFLIWNSEKYHGPTSKPESFIEGWYFKQVSNDEKSVIAIVPGVFYGNHSEADHHAFIFLNIYSNGRVWDYYFRFPADAISSDPNMFNITVGESSFTMSGMHLDIPLQGDNAHGGATIKGDLRFGDMVNWPTSLLHPSVMGPLQYIPFLDCYHGTLSMNHEVFGQLSITSDDEQGSINVSMSGGKGYLEKDYGITFPSCWIWMQSNHFSNASNASLFLALSDVPLVSRWGLKFPLAHIARFWLNGEIYSFATYQLSSVKIHALDQLEVNLTLTSILYSLEVYVDRAGVNDSSILFAPCGDRMCPYVPEALNAVVRIRLQRRWDREIVYEGDGRHAGLEVVGDVMENYKQHIAGWI